ncbi:unnamed protein product, partial [Cyprideis torosa]
MVTSSLRGVRAPKTRRGKRILEKREPQKQEGSKQAVFLRGSTASGKVTQVLKDLVAIRKSCSSFFGRKNDVRPFEDIAPVEQFARQHGAAIFGVGSHSKKRPHNVVLGRLFNEHLLDMFELGVDFFLPISMFPSTSKVAEGTKPLVVFNGEPFVADREWQQLRNLFLDVFRGETVESVRLQGLEMLIQVTALPEGRLLFRCFRLHLKKSGTRIPRVELEECGPRIDFSLRRSKLASEDLMKAACRQPKELKARRKKNVAKDALGSTLGR